MFIAIRNLLHVFIGCIHLDRPNVFEVRTTGLWLPVRKDVVYKNKCVKLNFFKITLQLNGILGYNLQTTSGSILACYFYTKIRCEIRSICNIPDYRPPTKHTCFHHIDQNKPMHRTTADETTAWQHSSSHTTSPCFSSLYPHTLLLNPLVYCAELFRTVNNGWALQALAKHRTQSTCILGSCTLV